MKCLSGQLPFDSQPVKTYSLKRVKMRDRLVKAKELGWDRVGGQPAGVIREFPLKKVTSDGAVGVVFSKDYTLEGDRLSFPKLSKTQMRKVEAVWRELGPAFECGWEFNDLWGSKMLFVDNHLYFVDPTEEPPLVVARARGWCLPHMDENTSALIEALKSRSCAAEEKWRLSEEEIAAKEREIKEIKERMKQEKLAAKEEELKLKKEAAARRQERKQEQAGQELLSLRCRKGDSAFSAGEWGR